MAGSSCPSWPRVTWQIQNSQGQILPLAFRQNRRRRFYKGSPGFCPLAQLLAQLQSG